MRIHMIVTGFFEPVLDRIPLEELRERVGEVVESQDLGKVTESESEYFANLRTQLRTR